MRGDLSEATSEIQDTLDAATDGSGTRAYLVGDTPISDAATDGEYESAETAEAIGVPIAFLICLLATGALVPAVLAVLGHRVERGGLPWRRRSCRGAVKAVACSAGSPVS